MESLGKEKKRKEESCYSYPLLFSYCNFLCERSRREVTDTLLNGLARLEYRGYDSAGKEDKKKTRFD